MCSNSSGVSSGALKKHSARTFPAGVSTQTSSLSFLETMICCMAFSLSARCITLTHSFHASRHLCCESNTVGERSEGRHIEYNSEPIVGIWQRHRKIKEKESNIYDPNRPPSAGSTGRWIHNPQLPPLHSFTIAFRPKSLVKTSTVTLNLIYTDLRKAPNLNSHSTKSLITSCMSYTPAFNGSNSKPTGKNSTTLMCTNGTTGGQKRALIKPSLKRL